MILIDLRKCLKGDVIVKNKRVLKKILAVLLCISVLVSVFSIVTSADNVVVNEENNLTIIPYFNPIGVHVFGMNPDSTNSWGYMHTYSTMAIAGLTRDDLASPYSFVDESRVLINSDTDEWLKMKSKNTLSIMSGVHMPSTVRWYKNYYADSVISNMYNPHHLWIFEDFVYDSEFTDYIAPSFIYTFADYDNHLKDVTCTFSFDIVYYDNTSLTAVTKHYERTATVSSSVTDSNGRIQYTFQPVDFNLLSEACDDVGVRMCYVTSYRFSLLANGNINKPLTSDSTYVHQIAMNLYDPTVAYPNEQHLMQYYGVMENKMPDVSSWLVSGVTGFLDAKIFGDVTLGAIFSSIVGIWLLLVVIKRFAGG